MKAWRLSELGDPWDVLKLQEVDSPVPGDGEARVKVASCDLNFADILQCQGTYQVRVDPPFTPGMAVAGTVQAAGNGCDRRSGICCSSNGKSPWLQSDSCCWGTPESAGMSGLRRRCCY